MRLKNEQTIFKRNKLDLKHYEKVFNFNSNETYSNQSDFEILKN